MTVEPIRYPTPLRPGDVVGVTAPSSGVPADLWPRLEFAVEVVQARGLQVRMGECLSGVTHVSASRQQRAAELQQMLLDPQVRAIVPPWGGETAIDLLDELDWEAIAAAEPTWMVGYSDISTLLTPLTLLTGVATVHGQNLMDTPYGAPEGMLSWLDVVTREQGATLRQRPPGVHAPPGFHDWSLDPRITEPRWTRPGGWARLDEPGQAVQLEGRLIGGCVEVLSPLAGTRYLDVTGWAQQRPDEDVLVYLEAAGGDAYEICRALHGMRLAGLFERAAGVLIGRTHASDGASLTQHEAVLDALGGLGIPLLADVECGHVAPHLALVNGARAEVRYPGGDAPGTVVQHLS